MAGRLKKVTGIVWCGAYQNGDLGWLAPTFVDKYPSGLSEEQRNCLTLGQRNYYPGDMYRVKVTIEPVMDKNGRYIVRRNPNKKP